MKILTMLAFVMMVGCTTTPLKPEAVNEDALLKTHLIEQDLSGSLIVPNPEVKND